jgi:lipoprotein-anchoring transpeptidase ErfK/SrfK
MPSSDEGQLSISIVVSVPRQRLDLLEGERVVETWPISTSKFGLGTLPGSYCTPTGRFVVSEAIGKGAPAWAIFKSRRPTGELAAIGGEEDHVLTRILWLDGLDPENANTHDRYVYIHGTNQEAQIGTPASHGCVRMRNADILDLFDRVGPGTSVRIDA